MYPQIYKRLYQSNDHFSTLPLYLQSISLTLRNIKNTELGLKNYARRCLLVSFVLALPGRFFNLIISQRK